MNGKAKDRDRLSPSENERIQARGAGGVSVSRARFGGSGAVELFRGNRLDIFGDLDGDIWIPPDPFALSPDDKAAADLLVGTLTVPSAVVPFQPFLISWEVAGPSGAHARVNSYQLNVFGSGPILGLSSEPTSTEDGLKASGSEIASMWQGGPVKLWARFGSGIRELDVANVDIEDSGCSDTRLPLPGPSLLLQTQGADRFLAGVKEHAGPDVTVTVTTAPQASYSAVGFSFSIGLRLQSSQATLDVDLETQFMVAPKAGHLGASFSHPGYRTVEIDADLPWYDDLWHTITLGEHDLASYYGAFSDGLGQLADGFAYEVGNHVRGLPGPDHRDYEQLEAKADKAIATAIDMSSEELVVTLCPVPSRLVSVVGLFPIHDFKLS